MTILNEPLKAVALLDIQGLVMRSYYAGVADDQLAGSIKPAVNTWQHGFKNFLGIYYDNILTAVKAPLNIILVVDDGSTYRKSLYREYKLHKKDIEKDTVESEQLQKCLDFIKKFLVGQGATMVRLAGEEADDVIGYLVEKLDCNKIIYTLDRDLIALAGDSCAVILKDLMVNDLDGVPPSCITLYKSFVGDPADGYPGIKGIGKAAWNKMVDDWGYDGLEQLSQHVDSKNWEYITKLADATKSKALLKATEDIGWWSTMFNLAKIAPWICESATAKLEWVKRAPYGAERLFNLLDEAGVADRLRDYSIFCPRYELVDKYNLDSFLGHIDFLLDETDFVAWDYETTDKRNHENFVRAANGREFVDVLGSGITGCSFSFGANANVVYYISVAHKDTANVDKDVVLQVIQAIENRNVPMVAQNVGSFEGLVTLGVFNHTLKYWWDTKLLHHHLHENADTHGLKAMSLSLLGYKQGSYKETLDAVGASNMEEISGIDVLQYGADDSLVTAHLFRLMSYQAMCEDTWGFIRDYECPAAQALCEATVSGVKIDTEKMDKFRQEDEEKCVQLMAKLRTILSENCTQPNFAGVDRLLADQDAYHRVKGTNLPQLEKTLKQNSYYVEYTEIPAVKEFKPTSTQLSEVTAALGLPPIEKVSLTYLVDWVEDNPSEFTNLLAPAINQFKARTGDAYEALSAFCSELLSKDLPKVKTGTELNLGSPAQNTYLFYLMLDLPVRIRTNPVKGSIRHKNGIQGSPATDESAIEFALANDCEGFEWKRQALTTLLEYKAAATRLGLFWTPYPLWLMEDKVMHPGFNSCGTVTRRPTGSNPNLLQVSKVHVRSIFIPKSPDNVIVSIDFASEELRVMAASCLDPTFLSAYTGEAKDLHILTACGILHIFDGDFENQIMWDSPTKANYDWFKANYKKDNELGELLTKIRYYAKTANFGTLYGAGTATLSRQLMIPVDLAKVVIESLTMTYPGAETWKRATIRKATQAGYVATPYGSRRHCGKNLLSGSRSEVGRWERQLINFLIQGACADMLKVCLTEMSQQKTLQRYGASLIAPIYDELLFEAPVANLYEVIHAVSDIMEKTIPGLCLPMVADCSFGRNWGEQFEVGVRPTREVLAGYITKL